MISILALKNLASLSARRAWIEIASAARRRFCPRRSLSARRAWIEILVARPGVDPGGVALRKESVDRNPAARHDAVRTRVALRKESVDRNTRQVCLICRVDLSLSARRAWIEIYAFMVVALLAVGRSPQGERG